MMNRVNAHSKDKGNLLKRITVQRLKNHFDIEAISFIGNGTVLIVPMIKQNRYYLTSPFITNLTSFLKD